MAVGGAVEEGRSVTVNIGIPHGARIRVENALMKWQRKHGANGYIAALGTALDGRDVLMNAPSALVDFLRQEGIEVTIEK